MKLKILVLALVILSACASNHQYEDKKTAYLFTYFTGNEPGEEAIRYALSKDGYNYEVLNNNQPIVNSKEISSSGGVRDPHILQGVDGKRFNQLEILYH